MTSPADLPLFEDDLSEPGVFEASTLHQPRDIPRVAVLCFFNDVLDQLRADGSIKEIHALRSEIGRNPVYEMSTSRGPVVVMHPGVGAPLAAGFTEELAALGSTTFVAVGGAGALIDNLAMGHVMVVDSALRDEGTSFHYAPPGRILEADPLGVAVADGVLTSLGIPHFLGRTWTTDALFRETRSRVSRRVAEGCSMVDMEASAFMAVSRYRGLRFAQLLYAGDSLAGDSWDSRHWDRADSLRNSLLRAALEVAWDLHLSSPLLA